MITIYHNPRCSKSRQGLSILEESGNKFEVIKYLDNPLSSSEIEKLLKKLEIAPIDLVRTNEAVWKEHFKGKQLTEDEVIAAMVKYPKLIERPIVVSDKGAVIGRPPENINTII